MYSRFMKLCLLRKSGISVSQTWKFFTVSCIIALLINIPVGWVFGRDNLEFPHYQVQVFTRLVCIALITPVV